MQNRKHDPAIVILIQNINSDAPNAENDESYIPFMRIAKYYANAMIVRLYNWQANDMIRMTFHAIFAKRVNFHAVQMQHFVMQ